MNSEAGWLRSPQALALLWASLVMALVLGVSVLVSAGPTPAGRIRPTEPLSDEAAVTQIVDSARGIVAAAQLQGVAGGYSFVSCMNEKEPPYQAALYLTFRLPHDDWVRYLNDVAAAMVDHGWTRSPAKGEHFGQQLARDGVTSVFHRDLNDRRSATMRLYGECRITTDHRNDDPAWTEVVI